MRYFTLHQAAPSVRPSAVHTDFIAVELSRIDNHMRDVQGLAIGTRRRQVRILGKL
ncbi:MAG: hypothetical protein PVJ72_19010 [Gammaproteobacteria bacterium]|jgi:hypothetical protein